MAKIDEVQVSISEGELVVRYTKNYKMGYDGFGYHSHDPEPPDIEF